MLYLRKVLVPCKALLNHPLLQNQPHNNPSTYPKRKDLAHEICTLHKHTNMEYDKISKSFGITKSTVDNMVENRVEMPVM